jgi:hypothetical protein
MFRLSPINCEVEVFRVLFGFFMLFLDYCSLFGQLFKTEIHSAFGRFLLSGVGGLVDADSGESGFILFVFL